MRRELVCAGFGLLLLARGSASAAARVVPEGWYEAVVTSTIEATQPAFDGDAAGRTLRKYSVAARPQALGLGNALSATTTAEAGFSTTVLGVEYGVAANITALAGAGSAPVQASVILAALKDSVSRAGLIGSWQWQRQVRWMELCPFDEVKLRRDLYALRYAYEQFCGEVIGSGPGPLGTDELWTAAASACGWGQDRQPAPNIDTALAVFIKLVSTTEERASGRPFQAEWLRRMDRVAQSWSRLKEFSSPVPDGCRENSDIRDMYVKASMQEPLTRLGAGIFVDLFPIVWGFQADASKPKTHGQRQRWEGRVEGGWQFRIWEASVVLAGGQRREVVTDPLRGYLSPGASLGVAVTRLSSEPLLDDKGRINVKKGKVPPRLVLGVELQGELAIERPESQSTRLNRFVGGIFADFTITDDLAFRLGVPLKGELVVRKADSAANPPVTEKRDIQWSLPPYVLMSIKL